MAVGDLIARAGNILKHNSPAILTALGVSGTIGTAYLTGKASFKASAILSEDAPDLPVKEKIRKTWRFYIPPAISGSITVGCIIGASRVGSKRTAAAYSLLSVSERAFDEYKDKVVETIGEKKEKGLRDQIAQDRVTNNPPMLLSGPGNVLCLELHTGRYFNCDIEKLRKAQNEINAKMIRENEASLSDFYYIVGLPYTSYSSNSGWTSDKLLELSFSTAMADDQRPCISFEYNYVKGL